MLHLHDFNDQAYSNQSFDFDVTVDDWKQKIEP